MVQFVKHMAACIFSLLLAGGCTARHLRAAEPSTAATQPQSIAVAGAPGTGLQDQNNIRLAQPTTAIAPAPAPQEWYDRLTGQEAALVADLRSALNKEIRDLDWRIGKQTDDLSKSIDNIMRTIWSMYAGILVGYIVTIAMFLPSAESMITFYGKGLRLIFPRSATV